MTLTLDPATRTPVTPEQAFDAFSDGHVTVFGVTPGRELVRTLAAWSAFETGRWRAMWDFNMTNMRGTWQGHATTFKASEIIDGKEVFLPPSADNLFRAYPDAYAGAVDTIRFVGTASNPTVRPNRYQRAWDAAMVGDLPTFVDGIAHPTLPGIAKVPGFFTANPRVYLSGMQRHAAALDPSFLEWARKKGLP